MTKTTSALALVGRNVKPTRASQVARRTFRAVSLEDHRQPRWRARIRVAVHQDSRAQAGSRGQGKSPVVQTIVCGRSALRGIFPGASCNATRVRIYVTPTPASWYTWRVRVGVLTGPDGRPEPRRPARRSYSRRLRRFDRQAGPADGAGEGPARGERGRPAGHRHAGPARALARHARLGRGRNLGACRRLFTFPRPWPTAWRRRRRGAG